MGAGEPPDTFTLAFAELRRMHDQLSASIAMQTPIIEGLILQAHKAEVTRLQLVSRSVDHVSPEESPEGEQDVPFEHTPPGADGMYAVPWNLEVDNNSVAASDNFQIFQSSDQDDQEDCRIGVASDKTCTIFSLSALSNSAINNKRWKTLVSKLLDLNAGVRHVQLKEEWSHSTLPENRTPQSFSLSRSLSKGLLSTVMQDGATSTKVFAGATVRSTSCMQRFFFHPDGWMAKLMLLLGALCLSYDIVTVPYFLCFGNAGGWVRSADVSLAIFWTCDFIISCMTGFHAKHVVEMRPIKVVLHYIRTWGVLDLVIITSDWTGVVLAGNNQKDGNDWVSTGRALKYYRFLRVLRMFRLLKVIPMLEFLVEGFATDMTLVMGKLLGVVVFIFLINHYIACIWSALGRYYDSDSATWIKAMRLEDSSNNYLYVISLHWALTQFTPATNNVNPTNMRERIFAFIVVLFALIIFSSFLGSLTNAISQLKQMHLDRYSEESQIRRFIFERHVSIQCARSIWNFYRTYAKASKDNISLNELPFLKKLPRLIRLALHEDISVPIITKHSAFGYLHHLNHDCSLLVCEAALRENRFHAEQEIFHTGSSGQYMLILNRGSVRYDCEMYDDVETLNAPHFISEVSVWGAWLHSGTLYTVSAVDTLMLNAKPFGAVIRNNCDQATFTAMCNYALAFIRLFNQCGFGPDGIVVTDIARPAEADAFSRSCREIAQEAFDPEGGTKRESRFSTLSNIRLGGIGVTAKIYSTIVASVPSLSRTSSCNSHGT